MLSVNPGPGGAQLLSGVGQLFNNISVTGRRTRSVNDAVVMAQRTMATYRKAFSNLTESEVRQILIDNKLCSRRILRQKNITFRIDENLSVRFQPVTSQIFIQQRGFRTNMSSGPRGMGRRQVEEGQSSSSVSKFIGTLLGRKEEKTTGSFDRVDGERYTFYEAEMKKLPENQRKTFTDGFLKGVLSSKSNTSESNIQQAKRISPSGRLFIFLAFLCFFVFWTGAVRVRVGDRPISSLIFPSTQEVKPEDVTVTFQDVRGMDEAKHEVEEIVSYLRDPDKYTQLGGRLPKGVLLVGPPGTGKTLLARAIAGEAQVPFFHTSGSEFDEVLVGQGARRVRDLFEKAKARSPCIIFIDEIDSVGSKRVSNSIHPYANQTINQLLSEMDGFNRNEGIIVIGATNRVDDLDKALLRPGRFDVRVTVPTPDLMGRKDIFRHYLGRVIHSDKVNVDTLAKGTTGFTGADIENMVNQAALKAATNGDSLVTMRHLDEARDRVLMGPARMKGRIPDEEANRNTAFHEAGHTLVGLFTKDATPLHKVTIIPRGQSLGHTSLLPDKDSYQLTRAQMLAQLDVMMGGRVAEELIFGMDKVTTGAADDMRKASQLASSMVGLRDFSATENSGAFVNVSDLSPQTSEMIDQEISRIMNESYTRAKDILTKHKKEHHLLAEALLEYETLSAEEVKTIVNGGKIQRATPAEIASKKKPRMKETRDAPSNTPKPLAIYVE
ncbi:hypothetical protein QR680_012635 [Steinernema hermaphroditum]|uniref:AAA+ ATPase domain-containing protein n=1 Tax=Steinernema hermaphroditum TaxID=289476 RepID=A0AA39I5E9_9BILA|nr:hypothetical protein QR680_012635 [Steinernema hermaphroditum]